MRLSENSIFDAQLAKYRPIARIDEVAAEFFAGEVSLIDQRDFVASLRQADGGGRPGRPGADDRNVEFLHNQPLGQTSARMRNGSARSR